jgi:serine protease
MGTRQAQLNLDSPQLASLRTAAIRGSGVVGGAALTAVDVVEFYNAPLNHYFITANPDEAAAIDRGAVGPSWARTGYAFRAYAAGTSGGGAVDVCRFFGTPHVGPSSHFFTGNAAECDAVRDNPSWIDEGIAFRALLPTAGACPAGTSTVVRFFWPGGVTVNSRHRYATDPTVIATMRAAGWIDEGPVFCGAP